ncbi:MAG: LysM peptidoglycan-binding domain-containing protein [Phenylobacterium sp.]|uniref:FecR family protein n=1 Tax=Phenylobacterium sp. TaxID=1871053 RepID=UPI001203B348|nr:FecR domain-containing protein [Phenylobacterium sp.]TAJ69606.1 MAG: LysM peptidoglycan-binding domain-containing protein [Phenylobacterium sp.]
MILRWGPLLLAAALPAAAWSADAPEAPTRYSVRAGDTLYDLAQRYLVRPSAAGVVQRLNRIADPRRLPIGRTLDVPTDLLRTEPVVARLVAYSGPVSVRGSGAGPLRLEMPVREGFELSTGVNAFLTFELPDGSRLTLPSQSRVRLGRLRRVLLTGAVQRDISLEEGRASSTVTPLPNPDSRFRILTPVAVSAVRGTEFRVRHDDSAGRSTVEVIEGRVGEALVGAPNETSVAAGFGASAARGLVSSPARLLPAPTLSSPARLQDEPQVTFAVRPGSGAAYRGQIARDAGFIDLISEVESTGPLLAFDAIPNGTFFVRLTTIDAAGLEGLPATYAFERRLNALGLDEPQTVAGAKRQYLFKWRSTGGAPETFRFVLARKADGSDAVIDAPGLAERQIVVNDLPPGLYYWRVAVARHEGGRLFEKWSPPQRFEIGR